VKAWPVVALLLSGCAAHELVRADDMSATQHRQEAQREQAVADKEAGAGPAAPAAEAGSDDWSTERRRQAERRREHSRQHASAAEFLEQFEDRECRHVPAGSRAACPLLGPVVRIDDVPGGIRATFADRERVPTVIAEMRCHYAYARSRNFDETIGCPLYVRGIEIREGLDPRSIEIVSRDERISRLLRERGRQQAVFVTQTKR